MKVAELRGELWSALVWALCPEPGGDAAPPAPDPLSFPRPWSWAGSQCKPRPLPPLLLGPGNGNQWDLCKKQGPRLINSLAYLHLHLLGDLQTHTGALPSESGSSLKGAPYTPPSAEARKDRNRHHVLSSQSCANIGENSFSDGEELPHPTVWARLEPVREDVENLTPVLLPWRQRTVSPSLAKGVTQGDFDALPGFTLSPEGIRNVRHPGVCGLQSGSSVVQMLCSARAWEPSCDAVDTSVPEPPQSQHGTLVSGVDLALGV